MFEQIYEPVGNLAVSTLLAAIPIIVLFVLLAGIRMAAQWAALITLAVALILAVLVYQMPIGLALNSTLLGICFGLFPIVWIVINAIFIYNVIVDTGLFETIRDSLAGVSNDRRIQVVLIAFVFGARRPVTGPSRPGRGCGAGWPPLRRRAGCPRLPARRLPASVPSRCRPGRRRWRL